jgi:hypothetical protein
MSNAIGHANGISSRRHLKVNRNGARLISARIHQNEETKDAPHDARDDRPRRPFSDFSLCRGGGVHRNAGGPCDPPGGNLHPAPGGRTLFPRPRRQVYDPGPSPGRPARQRAGMDGVRPTGLSMPFDGQAVQGASPASRTWATGHSARSKTTALSRSRIRSMPRSCCTT